MSDWMKLSAAKSFKVLFNGQVVVLSEEQISAMIKKTLKQSPAILKAFQAFGVSLEQLDSLRISIEPLDKEYALTDKDTMKLNTKLFDDQTDFFKDLMFIPLHEVVHFLYRVKEDKNYLNDIEEVNGFVIAIADYLSRGKGVQDVWRDIFPKMSWHFHNKPDAELFFKKCINKAKRFL